MSRWLAAQTGHEFDTELAVPPGQLGGSFNPCCLAFDWANTLPSTVQNKVEVSIPSRHKLDVARRLEKSGGVTNAADGSGGIKVAA